MTAAAGNLLCNLDEYKFLMVYREITVLSGYRLRHPFCSKPAILHDKIGYDFASDFLLARRMYERRRIAHVAGRYALMRESVRGGHNQCLPDQVLNPLKSEHPQAVLSESPGQAVLVSQAVSSTPAWRDERLTGYY